MSQRLVAIVLAILLCAHLAPVTALSSSEVCEQADCRVVPLYVEADDVIPTPERGLSSLPRHALAADPGAYVGGTFVASTPPLERELTLVKASAFQVSFSTPTHTEYVEGRVRVSAVALDGSSQVLAERVFTRPVYVPTPEEVVGDALDGRVGGPLVGGVLEDVERRVAPHAEVIDAPAGAAARAVYDTACANSEYHTCRQLTGRYGMPGATDLCAPAPPPNNVLAAAVWSAFDTVDGAQSPVTGSRACGTNAFDPANASAAEADAAWRPIREELPEASVNATSSRPAPHDWTAFTMDLDGTTTLPGTEETLRLPPGIRIVFDVKLNGLHMTPTGQFASSQLVIVTGSDTFLGVRTTTPQAFSHLAFGADLIGAGPHSGSTLSTRRKAFSFDLPPGHHAIATPDGGSLTLLDPDGARSSGLTATSPGRWSILVARGPVTYAFHLAIRANETDGGPIGEGVHVGSLGPGDDEDAYSFHADAAQRFELTLDHGADVQYDLEVPEQGLWEIETSSTGTSTTYRARADETRSITFEVVRIYGAGNYHITLDLDDDGNHSAIPLMTTHFTTPRDLGPITGYEGGVEFPTYVGPPSNSTISILRVTPDGVDTLKERVGWGNVIRRADGSLLYQGRQGPDVLDAPEGPLVVAYGYSPAFGPEHLYLLDGGALHMLRADRTYERYALPNASYSLIIDPAGGLIVNNTGQAYRWEGSNFTRAPHLDGVMAFDAAGRGYRVLNESLVERVDPDGGKAVVARAQGAIGSLAFAGERLYASSETFINWTTQWHIESIDLGTPGWEGFRPPFPLLPAPDLVPGGFAVVPGEIELGPHGIPGQAQTLIVTVENRGAGPAGSFEVGLFHECETTCALGPRKIPDPRTVPALAAGASASIEFQWHSSHHVGDQMFTVWVDTLYHGLVAETNETNNRASYIAPVIFGGQDEICRNAAAATPLPPGYGSSHGLCRFVRI